MKILYLGKDYEHTHAASWHYLMHRMENEHQIVKHVSERYYRSKYLPRTDIGRFNHVLHPLSKMQEVLNCFRQTDVERDVLRLVKRHEPDVIMLDSFFPPSPSWKNLSSVEVPKAMCLSDPHHQLRRKLEYSEKNGIDLCLLNCRFTLNMPVVRKWTEKHSSILTEWLPHCVNADVFRRYDDSCDFDVVSAMGVSSSVYPLRKEIAQRLSKMKDIRVALPQHALYELGAGIPMTKALVRERYAQFLSRSKVFVFGSSIYNYPLMKYFEGMACETLVLAPIPRDAAELRFKSGVNFMELDWRNLEQQILHFVADESERTRITRKARETVEKLHTDRIRAGELTQFLQRLI